MDRNSPYHQQVVLLLRILPFIAQEKCFALKGGTAINLFVRDFPRLSVDIDLVYVPDADRETALSEIKQALDRIAESVLRALPAVHIFKSYLDRSDALRLVINQTGVSVQVELSPVLRGTVFPVELRAVSKAVESEFGFAEISVVALEDLYAGKLCAAFDRQHPRDFFDVMLLLENEGITDTVRQAFLVYLMSHPRPMEEMLEPKWRSISSLFDGEFLGMTLRQTSEKELQHAAELALRTLLTGFTESEKQFLYSLYLLAPAWDALPFDHIKNLPAVRWKLTNIAKMSKEKRMVSLRKLERILSGSGEVRALMQ